MTTTTTNKTTMTMTNDFIRQHKTLNDDWSWQQTKFHHMKQVKYIICGVFHTTHMWETISRNSYFLNVLNWTTERAYSNRCISTISLRNQGILLLAHTHTHVRNQIVKFLLLSIEQQNGLIKSMRFCHRHSADLFAIKSISLHARIPIHTCEKPYCDC